MKLKKLLNLFFIFLIIIFSSKTFSLDIAVSPLLMKINKRPGTTEDFKFNIHSESENKVKITLYDMSQKPSGHMQFLESSTDNSRSMVNWVELKKNKYSLKKDEKVEVKGKIRIPKSAQGTYLVAAIIEEDKDAKAVTGVKLNVRYAVILAVNIIGKNKAKYKVDTTEPELIKNKDKTFLQTKIFNHSEYELKVRSTAQIRNEKGRLVEKVNLRSQSAWERKDDASSIYPRGDVILFGEVKNIYTPGEYMLFLRNKVGHRNLKAIRKNITITEDMIPEKNKVALNGSPVIILPSPLSIKIKKNNTSSSYLNIKNNYNKDIEISFDPNKNKHKSISSVSLYPKKFTLKPFISKRIFLKQTHLANKPGEELEYKLNYKIKDEKITKELSFKAIIAGGNDEK